MPAGFQELKAGRGFVGRLETRTDLVGEIERFCLEHSVVAAQVTDSGAQNPAADYVFSFTVNTLPTVTSTVPVNGATGVTLGSTITINFSESVNATGEIFISHTKLDGRYSLRLAIGNLHTTAHHVARAWALLQDQATQLQHP